MRANRRSQRPSGDLASEASHDRVSPKPAARILYTEAPFQLGQVIALSEEGTARARIAGQERDVLVDPSVDPTLLREAIHSGARVVLEAGHPPTIVGLLATQRALTIDRNGDVKQELRSLALTMRQSLLLKAPHSFLQMDKDGAVELFGQRLLTRARKLAKILAAHISLN